MRHLINISNQKSAEFSEKQKEGFETITDIEFPDVDPYISTDEIDKFHIPFLMAEVGRTVRELLEKYGEDIELCVLLEGELTLCYLLRDYLVTNTLGDEFTFVIPTTENKIKEIIKEDGTVEKTSKYVFAGYGMSDNFYYASKRNEDGKYLDF